MNAKGLIIQLSWVSQLEFASPAAASAQAALYRLRHLRGDLNRKRRTVAVLTFNEQLSA
jgi:hypothetical protein